MVPAYVVGVLQVFPVLQAVEPREDLAAFDRMRFHHVEFFRREFSGLVQNPVGYGDFPNIVHGRRVGDQPDFALIQTVLLIIDRHILEQDFGKQPDTADMLAGFQVAVLDDGGQHIDHGGVGFPEPGRSRRHALRSGRVLPPVG